MTSTSRPDALRASSSLSRLGEAFRAAPEPALTDLVGRHRATMVGPFWMRRPAPLFLHATGMPGWVGKEFPPPDDPSVGVLTGHNLVDDGGIAEPSLPMTARVAPSRIDGRAALVLTYSSDAPWPWRNVTDEVRVVGEGMLGMSYGILPGVPLGVPFLLHRT